MGCPAHCQHEKYDLRPLRPSGYPIHYDCESPRHPSLHNENDARVKWCHDMTTKGVIAAHRKQGELYTREWVARRRRHYLRFRTSVANTTSPKIFTEEMPRRRRFPARLRDSLMCRSRDYVSQRHLILRGPEFLSFLSHSPVPVLAHSISAVPHCFVRVCSRSPRPLSKFAISPLCPVLHLLCRAAISSPSLLLLPACRLLRAILWGVCLHRLLHTSYLAY